MKIYFSGIGGTAIGPLALIAKQSGYDVCGSDAKNSQYIDYLRKQGITDIHIGQNDNYIGQVHDVAPIDWFVYSSSVAIENPNHPELEFCRKNGIRMSKRDELLNKIIVDKNLKLIAVAGTHGKTTTTAMLIWLFKQLGIKSSYSVGAKISFGEMGNFDDQSEYFIYECDEFDRNFLAFRPYLSLITGIDWDHHEIFPTRQNYQEAFVEFIEQSTQTIIWQQDFDQLKFTKQPKITQISRKADSINEISLLGQVNRYNAYQVAVAANHLTGNELTELCHIMSNFPGLARRFEKITTNIYTDYAHTIPKIAGALQIASENNQPVVVIYEPLTNRRQYFIQDQYAHLFDKVKALYWVPSFLTREDPQQEVLSPSDLLRKVSSPIPKFSAQLDEDLKAKITEHAQKGDLVLAISGGGGGSLDEWLRKEFLKQPSN